MDGTLLFIQRCVIYHLLLIFSYPSKTATKIFSISCYWHMRFDKICRMKSFSWWLGYLFIAFLRVVLIKIK